jgi:protein ImuA
MLGIDPARLVLVDAASEADLLRAGLDIARCRGVAALVLESAGRLAPYDLTASRRLALAAERTGGRAILLRAGAEPRPSAAQTRWSLAAAPSEPWEAGAPGWPALDVELLRWRGGPAGRRWRLHWDGDHARFREAHSEAPLSGAVVPLAPHRTGEEDTARAA